MSVSVLPFHSSINAPDCIKCRMPAYVFLTLIGSAHLLALHVARVYLNLYTPILRRVR